MKTIKVHELEEVWYERTLEVPDDWTPEKIKELIKKKHLSAYELEDEEGVEWIDGEYLYDTAEVVGDMKIYDEDYNEIYNSMKV